MDSTTKMTTRIPKTLKTGLDVEAQELGISLNELCFRKLTQPLQDDSTLPASLLGEDASTLPASHDALEALRLQVTQVVSQNTALLALVQSLVSASNVPASSSSTNASTMPAIIEHDKVVADLGRPSAELLETIRKGFDGNLEYLAASDGFDATNHLTRDEFLSKYPELFLTAEGLVNDGAYGAAFPLAKTTGYQTPDGILWGVYGKGKNAKWYHKQPSAA